MKDLDELTLSQLKQLHVRISKEIDKRASNTKADLLKRMRKLAEQEGVTLEDLLGVPAVDAPAEARAGAVKRPRRPPRRRRCPSNTGTPRIPRKAGPAAAPSPVGWWRGSPTAAPCRRSSTPAHRSNPDVVSWRLQRSPQMSRSRSRPPTSTPPRPPSPPTHPPGLCDGTSRASRVDRSPRKSACRAPGARADPSRPPPPRSRRTRPRIQLPRKPRARLRGPGRGRAAFGAHPNRADRRDQRVVQHAGARRVWQALRGSEIETNTCVRGMTFPAFMGRPKR